MSTKYQVNVVETAQTPQYKATPALLTPTDESQVESVRDILQRYSITGTVYGRDPSKDSWTVGLDEKATAYSDGVDDALDVPDLSYMDEMEMDDYLGEHILNSQPSVNEDEEETKPSGDLDNPEESPPQQQ